MTDGLLLLCFSGILACYVQLSQIRGGKIDGECLLASVISILVGGIGFAMVGLYLLGDYKPH